MPGSMYVGLCMSMLIYNNKQLSLYTYKADIKKTVVRIILKIFFKPASFSHV